MRKRDGTGARGRPAGVDQSGSSKEIGPIRSPVVSRLGEVSEVPPVLPSTLAEDGVDEEDDEAFPALPPASGHRNTPGELLTPLQPPSGVTAAARTVGLNYSSLADRLATEAAAAAKAAAGSSGALDGTAAGDGFSRLSVLPSFGSGRGGEAKPGSTSSAILPISSDLRVLEGSSPGSMGTDGDVSRGISALPSQSPKLPSPPSRQAAAANSVTRCASAETAALRTRLRDRWFRLEAARKAQRQREAAERALMTAEDCATLGSAASVLGWNGGDGNHSSAEEGIRSGSDENHDEGEAKDRRDSSAHTAMTSATAEASSSAVLGAGVSPLPPRTVSASGMAAIQRAEVALVSVSTATLPMGTNTSSPLNEDESHRDISAIVSIPAADAELNEAAGPASCRPETTKVDSELSEEDGGRDSCGGGGLPAVTGEHVYAACQAGMAGLLNDLLVRSGGRAADGKDKLRRTPLHLAAEAGSLECVNLLLKQGTRLDQRDRWRETPLHKAARSGKCGIVKALCAARMKVNVRNRHRETPLLLAVRSNSADAVAVLLGFGARLDEPDLHGVTPVVQAARSGQAELLMTMANSNQAWKSSRDDSAPYSMVAMSDPASRARGNATGKRRALQSPMNPGSSNSIRANGGKGNGVPVSALSPLHEAAASGQPETLSLLLQLGVSLEERDAAAGVGGDTPLGRAVRAGQIDCAKLLLDAGAMVGRENARGETPLVVAIRAGQASAVELLSQHGAPLDGGKSNGRLTGADGRAPTGPREKMMARRRVEPLELALREGQLACAAALIEGGARINERTLRAVKLEPSGAGATEDKSVAQGRQVIYAGTSPGESHRGGGWSGNGGAGSATTPAITLPVQADILKRLSPEVSEISDSAPPNGGGLEVDPEYDCDMLDRESVDIREMWREKDLARREPSAGGSKETAAEGEAATRPGRPAEYVGGLRPALAGHDPPGQGRGAASEHQRQTSPSISEAAVAAAAFAATATVENAAWWAPAVIDWGPERGEVSVRFWGAGTMSAVVKHVYTGQPPSNMHADGLGRLLVASVSLRMNRLIRQVEHLLSARLSPQKGKARSLQHDEAARLLRAARVLRATDLEKRCTLYMQANGVFPAVMKLRRELVVPSLNTSDVTRGLARLSNSGYLGSGPAHAWSSSGAVSTFSASATVAAAKRAVDLSLRKRAVDFDQLVPLLLDTIRCTSTLSIGRQERAVLLTAALADACPQESPRCQNEAPDPLAAPQRWRPIPPKLRGCCDAVRCDGDRWNADRPAVPLVSNVSAFSHGMGWLLRTGTVADAVLVLPGQPSHSHAMPPATVIDNGEEDEKNDSGNRESLSPGGRVGVQSSERDAHSADSAVDSPARVSSGGLVKDEGSGRPMADSPKVERTTKDQLENSQFLAHSMVLASRSEKFAAMLRFVQRQDGDSRTYADSVDGRSTDDDFSTDADIPEGEHRNREESPWGDVEQGEPVGHNQGEAVDNSGQDGEVSQLPRSDSRRPSPPSDRRCHRRRRPRRNPAPREIELHSPLLTPQSLGLFLEFLYTGVLDTSLSTRELSELALIADEYLVPDLTRQAEALLVECLASRNAGEYLFDSTTFNGTTTIQSKREEDTASAPLELLQLGVSLALPDLSAAAARAVLLQLDRVSRSEAFEESSMSKRELVMAALEAMCS
ncbi:similar to ankyrin 2,3/unc44 [Ectocarpus siliculosus]|uniref:Similar to ankyrin 2,3/unc44 n=1 Tax=Ectocarpus siliculosus TaxID=2880 RepID=D7FPN9_ECTSI|nr:similar to ankyrin 2,3/unc44 [Ectocarpus siliculosus]|eukprot:CBJ30496.1 similar to ankyrin 2,3/unc44 [Ectocarpus siliculosus]